MGAALLGGWRARGLAGERIVVVEPDAEAAEAAHRRHGVAVVTEAGALSPDLAPAAVVIAVKPQAMEAVIPTYRRFVSEAVLLSIAAGKTIGYFAGRLGERAAIVRAMPNTPAAIGAGITVLCANARVSAEQRQTCERLMAAVGETAWVESEALMDAVTAVSGSGPAYVFLLIECLARAGVAAGLPEALALRLARVTVAGAGKLAVEAGEPPEVLRRNVTSPGGTTEAALAVLMAADGLAPLMDRAVAAAAKRSREFAD